MNVKQKEIVLISFPFTNQSGSKVRPALIISNNEFNSHSNNCLIIPMTTILKNVKYSFEINQKDLVKGKLIKKSRIRIDKINSIQKNLIKMKIGTVSNIVFNRIKKEINSIF